MAEVGIHTLTSSSKPETAGVRSTSIPAPPAHASTPSAHSTSSKLTASTSGTSRTVQVHITSSSSTTQGQRETVTSKITVMDTTTANGSTLTVTYSVPTTATTRSPATNVQTISSASTHTSPTGNNNSLSISQYSTIAVESSLSPLSIAPSVTAATLSSSSRGSFPVKDIVGIAIASSLSLALLLLLTRWLYSKRDRGLAVTPYNLPREVYPARRQRPPDRPSPFDAGSSDELQTPAARSHIPALRLDMRSPPAARTPRWSCDGALSSPGLHPVQKADVPHSRTSPAMSMSSV
ncbi:hypothetical protein WOLCODRAFT_167244 [Wolfiporia cocos MD-104 SS10]|uniref:Uncharacterized protein n=1 Tax=Wolfiporia cocos (strain MD-104) TaxID=742152 RepID=A0A2H3J5L9_WOLCO|nr:hypothetical protein WOLCODRAFT_167244 [Wolfiporia cocos MD-104 SS10]